MAPFSRLLCPIDFSPPSTRAIQFAAAIAACYNARLLIQYVHPPLTVSVPGLPDAVESLSAGEIVRLTAEVRECAARVGCVGPQIEIVIDAGRPADQIIARAARERVDLVVMGTHGASGFAHLLLGSVTEKVLRTIACPVLTVPPHAEGSVKIPFRRIVCAIDFSDWSMAALDLAVTLAAAEEATLIAVHAIEWPWSEPPAPAFEELPPPQADALREYRRYVTDRATARLQQVLTPARESCKASAEIVHGKPHVQLLHTASTHAADLIVLGVHGRSGVDVAVFGSTTNQVVRRASCPVLTVRQ